MEQIDLEMILGQLAGLVSAWGLKIIGATAVLIIGRFVARWTRRLIRNLMQRGQADATLVPFVAGLAYYLILAFVAVAVLGMVGVQTASMVAVLGAAGLAVGLALQGTLSNFASGVMLLVFRPFGVGDYIDAGGTAGSVESIGLFSTTLNTPDNVRIVIPNSAVYGNTIKNYAANPTRRNDIVVGVSYDDDLGAAMNTIERVIREDARVLTEPAPVVAISELGDSSVNIVVRPWCTKEDYWPLRFDLMRTLKEQLEAAGCSIPYPQRDVHLHQVS
ncbi:MAG: mechanosensitive ion channel [Gemmatimonadota bacterium]|nr:MAG: mechanosensitive ion channel [Gemmatimonadota bacterium]